jgi:hypothetical protein
MPPNPGQANSRTLPSGRPCGESPSDGSMSRAFAIPLRIGTPRSPQLSRHTRRPLQLPPLASCHSSHVPDDSHRSALVSTQFFRGQQCAEAPAGRRSVILPLSGHGGGQALLGRVLASELSWLLIDQVASGQTELPDGAPAVGRRCGGRECQDACHAVRRRRCPLSGVQPFGSHVRGPVIQPSGV